MAKRSTHTIDNRDEYRIKRLLSESNMPIQKINRIIHDYNKSTKRTGRMA